MNKVKGIVMTTTSVQGILAGNKTATRRVIVPQPIYDFCFDQDGEWFWTERDHDDDMMGWWPSYEKGLKPKYQRGDILWVRETWGYVPGYVEKTYAYKADDVANAPIVFKWRSPRYMPKAAARIFLHVKNVRVERLQDMPIRDAVKEGIEVDFPKDYIHYNDFAYIEFQKLWNSLNEKRGFGWDINPWVWVIEFERCAKPQGWPQVA